MGTAQTVVGGTHAVIQLHREGAPAGGFTGFDGQLQDFDGFRNRAEPEEGFSQNQLRPGTDLGGDLRQGQELGHEVAGPLAVALPDPGAGFREAQFQGRSRVLVVLKKVLNRAVQPFGDDLQRPRRRACPAKFHLVEKRAAEVLLGDTGQAEPQFHPDLADPGA